MKLTNKYGYPEAIVKAIENDTYSRGDSEFSATSLIQPARIQYLTKKYADEIEEDIDDKFKLIEKHIIYCQNAQMMKIGSGEDAQVIVRYLNFVISTLNTRRKYEVQCSPRPKQNLFKTR